MQTPLIVANWKMNPATPKEAKKLFTRIRSNISKTRGVQVVVCPPYVYVSDLARGLSGTKVVLGAQDLFYEEQGAFTGQISASMLKSYKANHVIIGHSELRALGESNEMVRSKVQQGIRSGMKVILCVGERDRNDDGTHYKVVREQLDVVCEGLKRVELASLIIAYEPVWAIGKRADQAMGVAELYEMSLFIRKLLIERFGRKSAEQVRLLYGAAVKPENAAEHLMGGGVEGFLVGSASLNAEQFTGIVEAVAEVIKK